MTRREQIARIVDPKAFDAGYDPDRGAVQNDIDRAVAVALAKSDQIMGLESISTDGPHPITEHRRWLARQLLDSKLSEAEAFEIVAHHPALKGSTHDQ